MRTVIVTGSVGTGKTTYAQRLCKKHSYKYIDVNTLISRHHIYDSYDRRRKAKIVDTKKLNKFLIKLIKDYKKEEIKGLVIDSHLSHYLPAKYVDLCIVTKCGLKKLKKRLDKRSYSKQKVRENLNCEIFDVCLIL